MSPEVLLALGAGAVLVGALLVAAAIFAGIQLERQAWTSKQALWEAREADYEARIDALERDAQRAQSAHDVVTDHLERSRDPDPGDPAGARRRLYPDYEAHPPAGDPPLDPA